MYRYMSIIFPKRLLLLVICVGLAFLLPEVKLIAQVGTQAAFAVREISPLYGEASSSLANVLQANNLRQQYITPQQLQRQQAVRQRRNLEIQKVLNSDQQGDLRKLVHGGNSFDQAIAKLEISSKQREILKTIQQLYTLKLEALKK